ncbi:MAG: hypothetical protein LBH75_05310 [Treponema sp.]|jgi:hypothetical protein|nr:hypothetical protein [Treponema sp.]
MSKLKKAIAVLLYMVLTASWSLFSQDFGLGGLGDFVGQGLSADEEAGIRARMMLMELDGVIPMRFANALDGKPIAGAVVDIPGIGRFQTNGQGISAFPKHADGVFTMTVSKKGFITTPIDFSIQLGRVLFNWYSLSPDMEGDFRFILDWGEKPDDLDLHFEKSGVYHVSWRNMHDFSSELVKLDRDDVKSYGPETITAEKIKSSGNYRVFVHDFTNRGARSSQSLAESGATIRVYSHNRLVNTFSVPQGVVHTWNVFNIINGQVVPVQTLGN